MELRWTVHLAKKEPRKTVVLVGCAVLGGLLGVIVVGSFWMLPFGALVILMGTADYLLPVRYSIDAAGAKSKCGISTTAIGWEQVKRVIEGPDGVKLSPLETSSRLAPFRGVFLRADGNLQEIRACVEY